MSNPNPKRQTFGANTIGMKSDKAGVAARKDFGAYAPRIKPDDEVRAPSINLFKLPAYKPEQSQFVRSGADDHLKFKSTGGQC